MKKLFIFLIINILSNCKTEKFQNISKLNLLNNTNYTTIYPPYLRRKSKFCHFKCNCFFSHNVVNDNIYVTNWIKSPGL